MRPELAYSKLVMSQIEYLEHDRANKLSQAVALAAGKVSLHVTIKGVQKGITQQSFKSLKLRLRRSSRS